MSKLFSVVRLETSTGVRDIETVSGIPEAEEIQDSRLYKELVEDCGSSDYITVNLKSYLYGEGEPEKISGADLDWIKNNPGFVNSEDVTCINASQYTILYPDQGMQLTM
ncbi:hypothetical protein [Desulfitobacterium hafniense]|uniref:hypothetical protein n=1 Tax=Desulfitobacterium hafniense TaxID=49338 RepID=UPI0002E05D2B|nr:hypothetical protein [Desulfitobacterium hafniense]